MPGSWNALTDPMWGQGWWNAPRTPGTPDSTTPPSNPIVPPGASGIAPAGGMDLTALTTYINDLNRRAQEAANRARVPNSGNLETISSGNIKSELAGVLPEDVLRQLRTQSAERGVSSGLSGSPNEDSEYLRALGLTSLDLTGKGQSELSAAYARNPGAPIFDPTTQLMTPAQSSQLAMEQERLRLEQERLDLEAQLKSAGGGGGGRTPGAYSGDVYPRTTTTTTPAGPTGALLRGAAAPAFGAEQWWNSIGYGNTPAAGGGGFTPEDFGDESLLGFGLDDLYGTGGDGGSYTFGNNVLDPSLFEG